ncbi:MAG: hypothetical protein ACYSU3_09815 [Planctomycetota bacterium]
MFVLALGLVVTSQGGVSRKELVPIGGIARSQLCTSLGVTQRQLVLTQTHIGLAAAIIEVRILRCQLYGFIVILQGLVKSSQLLQRQGAERITLRLIRSDTYHPGGVSGHLLVVMLAIVDVGPLAKGIIVLFVQLQRLAQHFEHFLNTISGLGTQEIVRCRPCDKLFGLLSVLLPPLVKF